MTIVIKKSDPTKINQKKIKRLQKNKSTNKSRTFSELCGSVKGVFKKDAVII
jgi:ribosomal protein S14